MRPVLRRGPRSPPPLPPPPAGAAAEAGREERPSAPRADGVASPPRLSRCTEGAAGPRSPRQSRSMVDYIVEYDYDAVHDDELTIRVGEIIRNVKKTTGRRMARRRTKWETRDVP